MKIPFSPPDITEHEISEVIDTLQSGWITTGPKTKEFEKVIADYCGVSKAVCLNSATSCLEMALRILGIGPGDEVIVPAYTYTATVSPVYHLGAKIVMIDSQKDNYQMDYEQVAKAISKNTKAIIPVDLAGIPCDYEQIFSIVEGKRELFKPDNAIQKAIGRIAVCTDGAHAFGAKWNNRNVGSIADFTSFSFHAVKNLTTAEGGALTWRSIEGISDEEIYNKIQLLSLHGQSKDALAKSQSGAWEYDIVEPLFKCNMTDIMAAIGLAQARRYPELLKRRKEIIEKYDKEFRTLGLKPLVHFSDQHTGSGHLYLIRIPGLDVKSRNEIIIKLADKGIATNVHYKPLPMMSGYKRLGFNISNYPNAFKFYENLISLPLHTKLSDEEVNYILVTFKEILREYL